MHNCYWRVLVRDNNLNKYCESIALCVDSETTYCGWVDNDFIHLCIYQDAITIEVTKNCTNLKYDYIDFVKLFESLGYEKEDEEYIDYCPTTDKEWYDNTYFMVKNQERILTFDELIALLKLFIEKINLIENKNFKIRDKVGIYKCDDFNWCYGDYEYIDEWI